MAALSEPAQIKSTSNRLTAVIPFYNERDEVRNTVKSVISSTSGETDIIVINDCSDDGYPYEDALQDLNVNYCVNSFRLGAALSKERGVRLSRTPYFIILDSHMRLFTNKWHNILTERLDRNPNQLLCCQSKAIIKQTDGSVKRSENKTSSKGAFLTFREDRLIPGIHWYTRTDRATAALKGDEIAAVLGGCYSSSKKYWTEINGLEGLLHYGCEEAYISIKSWLKGGGCHFVSEIETGHIYRREPTFEIKQSTFIYNYLAISEICFPESERIIAHAVARCCDPTGYASACELIEGNRDIINKLRRTTEPTTKEFEKIIRLNMSASLAQSGLWEKTVTPIEDMADLLCRQPISTGGLTEGYMGNLLFLLSYISLTGKEEGREAEKAAEIYRRIETDLTEGKLSWNIATGYAGIGWGLLYIRDNRLLEDDPESLLAETDRRLSECSPGRISDMAMQTGTGGLMRYVSRRITDKGNMLSEEFVSELKKVARETVSSSRDPRCVSAALQLIADEGRMEFSRPKISDIITPMRFIAKNRHQWKSGLNGPTGHILELIEMKLNDKP